MAPCKAVFIIEWITMDKKVKMKMKKKNEIRFLDVLAISLSLKIPGVQKLRAWRTSGVGFTWNAPWPLGSAEKYASNHST